MDTGQLKILYIIPGFDEGGAEIHVLNLIREMKSFGHEITLISSGGRLENELPDGVNIIHMPVYSKNPARIISCALKISDLSKKFHWDIIHAHSRVPAWIARLVSKKTGIKWLMTAHALYSLNFGITPFRHADGLICISKAVENHLSNYLPDNSIIIPNGITLPKLKHKDFEHDGKTIKFLTVGRLSGLKGIDVALKALSKLKNYNWTLDVVGEGPKRKELEDLSDNLGISGRVKFHGDKERFEVEHFMAVSSCMLFPSFSEGMGLAVLEALSVGLPVIASDLEALQEISEGQLVPSGNVEAWRDAIKKFIENGKSSPLNSENIITVHDMAVQIEGYYKKLLWNE